MNVAGREKSSLLHGSKPKEMRHGQPLEGDSLLGGVGRHSLSVHCSPVPRSVGRVPKPVKNFGSQPIFHHLESPCAKPGLYEREKADVAIDLW